MRIFLFTISIIVAFPLVADERLDQLYQSLTESYRNNDYDAAIEYAKEFLQIAKNKSNTYFTVRGYLIHGFLYSKTEEFGKAVLSYLEGARFAESSQEEQVRESLIIIYKNLAVIMGDYKHFDLAHKFNQKGLDIALSVNDEKQIIDLLHNDGFEYVEEKKYDQAIKIFMQILYDHSPTFRKKLGLVNDLGLAYWNLGRFEEAIGQYELVLSQCDSIDDAEFITKVIHNLGLALMDKQEYGNALLCFKESLKMSLDEGFINGLFANYKYAGLSQHKLGRKEEALAYYLKAAELFDSEYVDPEDYDIFELIADFYQAENRHELAFKYERLYNDHLETYIARQKEIEELDKKYNIELVTQRYFDLLAAEEQHRKTVQIARWSIGGVLALFLITIGAYLYRYHRKRFEIARAIREIERNSKV